LELESIGKSWWGKKMKDFDVPSYGKIPDRGKGRPEDRANFTEQQLGLTIYTVIDTPDSFLVRTGKGREKQENRHDQ